MKIRVIRVDQNNDRTREQTYKFLERIDREFFPPLSGRGSSVATNLGASFDDAAHQLGEYVDEVMGQVIVFAKLEGQIIGIFTFKSAYYLEAISNYCPCNYITTVGTHPDFRNQGVGWAMYHFALNRLSAKYPSPYWVTRTWSTNQSHLVLLDKLGFIIIKVLKNDRGNAVDTLYLALPLISPCDSMPVFARRDQGGEQDSGAS